MTEQTYEEYKKEFHHPWCNFFFKPREGCKMCEKFYNQYPINDENANVKSFNNPFPYNEKEEPVKKSKIKHFLTSLAMIPVIIVMLTMCILLLETPEQVVARWLYWWYGDNY